MSKHHEPENVTNPMLKAIMHKAAKGRAADLAALQELIDIRTLRRSSTEEAESAQTYARQMALTHAKLRVEDDQLRELMEEALERGYLARAALVLAADDKNSPSQKEAREVLWFVNKKWEERGWPLG